jgi:hypothetical protein
MCNQRKEYFIQTYPHIPWQSSRRVTCLKPKLKKYKVVATEDV